MRGWIALNREIMDHWLYKTDDPFTKREAWLDILLMVNHSDQKVLLGESLHDCKRGESLLSQESWAKRWNWNKSKVRRFLNLLKSDSMIELKANRKTTHLTVCNYEKYQGVRTTDESQVNHKRITSESQLTPNNNGNHANHANHDNKQEEERMKFAEFWSQYKTGNKKRAFEKWQKLSEAQKTEMLEKLPAYLASTPNGNFRKNGETYLNKDAEYWNDDIRTKTGEQKPNTQLEEQYANAF